MSSQSNGTPIGCQRDAQKAFDGKLAILATSHFRRVYLDAAAKVVYKVDIEDFDDANNLEEAQNSDEARLEFGELIPRVSLWYVDDNSNLSKLLPRRIVLAMSYYSGDRRQYRDKGHEYCHRVASKFWDAKEENIAYTEDGEPRLIDLQFYSDNGQLINPSNPAQIWCPFNQHWFTPGATK